MLVLSRHESQKVLFPSLNISIEVTRVQGKTVRMGINAPKEIRVIRGELQATSKYLSNQQPNPTNTPARSLHANQEIQKCLDAANLAIHLAQNQLRQKLANNAEAALDNALHCLENLENAILQKDDCQAFDPRQSLNPCDPIDSTPGLGYGNTDMRAASVYLESDTDSLNADSCYTSTTETVREPESGYLVSNNVKPIVLLLESDDRLRDEMTCHLVNIGCRVLDFGEGISIIKYLENNRQPDAIIMPEYPSASVEAGEKTPQLNVNGVSNLRSSKHQLAIGGTRVDVALWACETFELSALSS